MLNTFCKYFPSPWTPEMMLFVLLALPRVWVPLHDCMGRSPTMQHVQWSSQLEPWIKRVSGIKSVGRYTVCSPLKKNVGCNLVGVLVWTEVGVQVRIDGAAHLHEGGINARVTRSPPVCASAPYARKIGIFWIVKVIRAMTSCFLVLVCNCVEWRNFSFHLASYCFQRWSWNFDFLRSTLTTVVWL